MKKSLLITDDEKYGRSSARPASTTMPGEEAKKEKPVKRGILIELVGPQVDAFCTCSKKMGDTGTATVTYKVKSMSEGDEYDSAVDSKNGPKRMKLLLTHVEADDAGGGKEDAPEKPEGEDDEPEETTDETPEETVADRPSPKDVGMDDEG